MFARAARFARTEPTLFNIEALDRRPLGVRRHPGRGIPCKDIALQMGHAELGRDQIDVGPSCQQRRGQTGNLTQHA